ncbi:laccase-5-like isoform X2 [Odontomachus brunneus]|uniref:laccase-5-like isoform X2 n=1 Tax=Odontomachus brunneus TaxID=486640 RepID=UPI0013F194AD|nr:laccase-5-like isoform X2 [Odontomachus brunneus]
MRPRAETCVFVLIFFIYSDIQFCKAYWWWWWSWSSTPTVEDMETTPLISTTSTASPSEQCSTSEECARQCQDGESPKLCCYQFIVEYYTTNGKACDFCQPPVNDSRINSQCQCIISDGFEKTVFSINRMIPGPSIQVCKGDTIRVNVKNDAEGSEVTIHWHGIFQKGSQYYDGVPFVTQCPIMSSESFRYIFRADNSGTHFYHSHIAAHIIDGQHGSLIVRDPPSSNPHVRLYDYDFPQHVVIISDLYHELTMERFPGRYRSNSGQVAQNFLINGRGDWTDPTTGVNNNISYSTLNVVSEKKYRFRFINACGAVCPVRVSIESHSMMIIATDGEDVEPIEVNAINMASGERFDVVVYANQTPGQYWIVVKGLGECIVEGIYQLAILDYGSSYVSLSPKPLYSDLPENIDRTFNPLNSTDCGTNLCVHQTCKKDMSDQDKSLLNEKADMSLKLSFDFFNYTLSPDMYKLFTTNSPDYKKFFVAIDRSHLISRINNISYVNPPEALILATSPYKFLCEDHSMPSTCTEPCTCTHVYNIPRDIIVDVMIYDKEPLQELNHPFHLHGYNFCVLYSGQFQNAINKSYITEQDAEYELQVYNQQHSSYNCCAPKDTVIVPNTGYVILRFKADNPGWWFFHCHFSWHTMAGMNVVFHVGKPRDLPPIPTDFPECHNFPKNIDENN